MSVFRQSEGRRWGRMQLFAAPLLRAWLSYLETDYRTAAGGLRFLPSSSAAMSSTLRGASDL